MLNATYQIHCKCPMEIRYKLFNSGRLTPAMFCTSHNVYLDWITNEQANYLINEMRIPVRDWQDKPKNTTKNKREPNLLAQKCRKKHQIRQLVKDYKVKGLV